MTQLTFGNRQTWAYYVCKRITLGGDDIQMTGCKYPGCARPHKSKGWCGMHYMRDRDGTDMDAPARVRKDGWHPFDRVMLQVAWVGECLEYIGHRDPRGYGQLGKMRVHVIVWEYYNGPVSKGMVVRHAVCENPPCCNIEHLLLGTQQDNAMDALTHGRIRVGVDHPSAKLTVENVKYIRDSSESSTNLASLFDVSRQTIDDVRNGITWKHLL